MKKINLWIIALFLLLPNVFADDVEMSTLYLGDIQSYSQVGDEQIYFETNIPARQTLESLTYFIASIISPLIITGIVLIKIPFKLDDKHIILKCGYLITTLFIMLIGAVLGSNISSLLGYVSLANTINVAVWLIGITIFIVFLYSAVYLLTKALKRGAEWQG